MRNSILRAVATLFEGSPWEVAEELLKPWPGLYDFMVAQRSGSRGGAAAAGAGGGAHQAAAAAAALTTYNTWLGFPLADLLPHFLRCRGGSPCAWCKIF